MATKKGGNKSDVLEVKMDASLTAEDLAAEIAASASAIGEAKTVKGKSVKTETKRRTRRKSTTAKKPSKAKAVKKTPATKAVKKTAKKPPKKNTRTTTKPATTNATPTKTTEKSESVSIAVTVKTKKPAPATPPAQKKIVKKPQLKSPVRPDRVTNLRPKPEVLNRHGKDIKPLRRSKSMDFSAPAPKVANTAKPLEAAAAQLAMDHAITHAVIDDQSHDEVVTVSHTETNAPSERQVEIVRRKRHVARIYDTYTYHMPIEVNYHTRKNAQPRWVQYLVLAIAVVVLVLVAIQTDIFDI